jgi:hypothetical protein
VSAPGPDAVRFGAAADDLLDRLAPILEGQPAELQGAVIADMTALWLAGHRVQGDRAEGDRVREKLLQLHATHVRELVEMYLEGVDG